MTPACGLGPLAVLAAVRSMPPAPLHRLSRGGDNPMFFSPACLRLVFQSYAMATAMQWGGCKKI